MECDSGNCSRENTKLGAMLTCEKGSDKEEELVRYMSSLPTYLQGGKAQQEKAFNVGVLDWKHLKVVKQFELGGRGLPQSELNYKQPSQMAFLNLDSQLRRKMSV
ncbi:unnamed protein product [Cuscuta campestris]|uniref:Uncharacterized protein n=1 Tax=Cuscuta campestris TaxID=132261 RepID=A0A484NSB4_9ASTE|nr:unnamed protein product [Cuscuta campestris]